MYEPFQPILDAVSNLDHKCQQLAHGNPHERDTVAHHVNTALEDVGRTIDRISALGLPGGPCWWDGGEKGWAFDLQRAIHAVFEGAKELVAASLRFPALPDMRGSGSLGQSQLWHSEWFAAEKELARLELDLRARWNTLWNLQQHVQPPTKSGPQIAPLRVGPAPLAGTPVPTSNEIRQTISAPANEVATPNSANGKTGGRPKLGAGLKDPSKQKALRNVYCLIRAKYKPDIGPKALLDLFRNDKDFCARVTEAGKAVNLSLFKNAIAWIKDNPDQKT